MAKKTLTKRLQELRIKVMQFELDSVKDNNSPFQERAARALLALGGSPEASGDS